MRDEEGNEVDDFYHHSVNPDEYNGGQILVTFTATVWIPLGGEDLSKAQRVQEYLDRCLATGQVKVRDAQ